MTTEPIYTATGAPGTVVVTDLPDRKRVSWGAIFAGTVLAIAVMVLLGLLGAGIGLWAVEPGGETDTIMGMTTVASIYFVVSQLVALFVGGYAASRLSAAWDGQTATLHGATIWGVTTLASLYIATTAASTIFYTATSALQQAGSVVAQAGQAIMPNDLPNFSVPDVDMKDLPAEVQTALRRQGVTAENFKGEARDAFRSVISRQEQSAIRDTATNAAVDVIRTPDDAMSDINGAIDNLVGQGGVISQEERTELMGVMERRFGISQQEAEKLVASWEERAKSTYEQAQATFQEAQTVALNTAQEATDALSAAAFWAFLASVLGLVAACMGAGAGRRSHPVES